LGTFSYIFGLSDAFELLQSSLRLYY